MKETRCDRCAKVLQCYSCLNADNIALRDNIKALEEVLEDKQKLTRELDVAIFGPEGAAKQASLCDLIGAARYLRREMENFKVRDFRARSMIRRLINKTNLVTSHWRHHGVGSLFNGLLSELYERQLLAEEFLNEVNGS